MIGSVEKHMDGIKKGYPPDLGKDSRKTRHSIMLISEHDDGAFMNERLERVRAELDEMLRADPIQWKRYEEDIRRVRYSAAAKARAHMGAVATSAADSGVTHVVASERNAPLTKALELIALEDVITITPEWITESYKQNRALPVDAPEFAPRVLIRALPDRPHSQDTETSSEAERKALAARERKERARDHAWQDQRHLNFEEGSR